MWCHSLRCIYGGADHISFNYNGTIYGASESRREKSETERKAGKPITKFLALLISLPKHLSALASAASISQGPLRLVLRIPKQRMQRP
jgi:hypothetical protein